MSAPLGQNLSSNASSKFSVEGKIRYLAHGVNALMSVVIMVSHFLQE